VGRPEFALGSTRARSSADGGTLQIGIGALSDALVHALLLRQRDNATNRDMLGACGAARRRRSSRRTAASPRSSAASMGRARWSWTGSWRCARRACSFARVRRPRAADAAQYRRAARDDDADTLDHLIEAGLLPTALDRPAVDWLMRFGLLPDGTTLADGHLRLPDGEVIGAELLERSARAALALRIAGRRLRGGCYLHGGVLPRLARAV